MAVFSQKMQKAETQEGMNLDQEMTVKLLGKGDKKQLHNSSATKVLEQFKSDEIGLRKDVTTF